MARVVRPARLASLAHDWAREANSALLCPSSSTSLRSMRPSAYSGWLLALLLSLTGCAASDVLPLPPTATTQLIAQSPTASATVTVSGTPAPPTATPEPSSTPTATLTPTPALPSMRLFTDEHEIVRVRVPEEWGASEEGSAVGLQVGFENPAGGQALLILVNPVPPSDPLAVERFIEAFTREESVQQEILDDGSIQLSGERETATGGTGRFEMRVRQRGRVLAAIIALMESNPDGTTERVFQEAFASFRIFPSQAISLFGGPEEVARSALDVLSTGHYYAEGESLWVIGEVINQGEGDAESLVVTVELLTAGGEVAAVARGFSELDLLLAGESAPFVALFDSPPPPGSWLTIHASAEAAPAGLLLELSHKGLIVEEVSSQAPAAPALYSLTGTVANEGDNAANFVRVVGALYDIEGRMIATASSFLSPSELAPGESVPFTISFPHFAEGASEVADFAVWVAGSKER